MSNFIEINRFSGGVADSNYLGIAGSFGQGSRGIDIHSKPATLQSEWKLTKDSGTTVTDLILWGFPGSDGKTYFFGDTGKCYVVNSGVWSLSKDLASRICGAFEYNGYIYVATSNTLYRVAKSAGTYDLANLTSWQTWTGNEIDNSWHPMIYAPSGSLLIAAGQYISEVDNAGIFNSKALDLPPDWRIKCLGKMGDNLLIGAYNLVFDESAMFIWDCYSDSFFSPVPCPENIINLILSDGRTIIVQAGQFGNIYQFTGNDFLLIRKIPGIYKSTAIMTMHPQAAVFYYGQYLLGISNSSGNPVNEGVWRLARFNNNYPLALDLAFVISTGNTSGVDIGCILQDGVNFYISWKDTTGSTTYGVDKIDYTTKYNGIYETVILGSNSPLPEGTKYTSVIINCEPLAASTSITLKYRKNGNSSWSAGETFNTTQGTYYRFCKGFPLEAKTIEFQLTLTSNGTNTPVINSILIEEE